MIKKSARMLIEWLILLVFSLGLATWLIVKAPLHSLDNFIFDAFSPLIERPAPDDIVIVSIDRKTMQKIKTWPYPRAVHAKLLDQLTRYQPSVVAFDMLFYESMGKDDLLFARAIKNAPPVFLPIAFESIGQTGNRVIYPVDALKDAATGLGHVHIEVSSDSSVREVYLWQGLGSPSIAHISLAVCRYLSEECRLNYPVPILEQSVSNNKNTRWLVAERRLIPYVGEPGSFLQLSYLDVLEGRVLPEKLKGKIVFIGTTDMVLGDYYTTPSSWNFMPMSGVEILANIFDMLRQPNTLYSLSVSHNLIFSWLLITLILSGLFFLGGRANILLLVGCCVGAFLLSVLLIMFFWIWFSPVVLWVVMLCAFPVWGWRRLGTLQQDLDARIQQLLDIPMLMASNQSVLGLSEEKTGNSIGDRIYRLKLISERIRTVQALVQYGLNSFPGIMLMTDPDWHIALMNQQATQWPGITLYRGQPLCDFLRMLGVAEVADLGGVLEEVAKKKQTSTFLVRGETECYLVCVSPCYFGDDSVVSLVVCILNVTTWQLAKEAREDFMRFLSHDIRSPLASIIMSLDDSQFSAPENDEQRQLLDRIRHSAERSLTLADNFLQLARAESLDAEKFVELDLFDLVEIAIDELWAQAKAVDITLLFDRRISVHRDRGVWVVGERDLLIRMIINLGSNAIKYSPAKSTVSFSVIERKDFWGIRVCDQGEGIAPDQLSQIFNKFGRAKRQGGVYRSGIGLGLMIVKAVVERHHGYVQVSSEPKKGACFSVYLPVAAPPEGEDEAIEDGE